MTPITARYFKADGKAGSKKSLPADPFDGVVHENSMYEAVKAYLANQRQGTASAKTRSEVRGGGRKPFRQKGTGRARAGTTRSPIWRGGGIVFPPIPRSYRQELPKKVRRLARRSAFNARAAEDQVVVIQDMALEAPKTRQLVKLLEKIGVVDSKVLILTAGLQENVQTDHHREDGGEPGRGEPVHLRGGEGREQARDQVRGRAAVQRTRESGAHRSPAGQVAPSWRAHRQTPQLEEGDGQARRG